MRLWLALALAAMATATVSILVLDHRQAEAFRQRESLSQTLGGIVEIMAAQLVHLDGVVSALAPNIAADDRNALRRSVPRLEALLSGLDESREAGAMAPKSLAMMDNPYVRPLALLEGMVRDLRAVAQDEALWGEAARFRAELVQEATIAALPMIGQLQAIEAAEAARIAARTEGLRMAAALATVAILAAVWLGIFRPLERRVMRDRRALQEGVRRAEAASEAKSRFVATMSHEIRTPLVGVLGAADLMRSAPLEPEQADLAGIILSSGRSLLGVLDDVLDFARIEAGHLDLAEEPLDAAALVEEVGRLFEAQARTKGVALRCELPSPAPPPALGDAVRIRQALSNLAGNAVKFTEAGSVALRLVAGPSEAGRRRLAFEVEDTGPGMEAQALARVFEAFEQADGSTARRHGGTGLGLAISSRLAAAMGGRIVAESEPGRGSLFRLELSLPDAPEAAPAAIPEPEGDERADGEPLVLVADDNATNRLILSRMLAAEGCRVETAEDGSQAVALWSRTRPDLVLMDVAMPRVDGLSACRMIRASEAQDGSRRTPIVAVSAHVGETHRATCLDAGMDEALGKPFTRTDLRGVLRRAAAAPGVPLRDAG